VEASVVRQVAAVGRGIPSSERSRELITLSTAARAVTAAAMTAGLALGGAAARVTYALGTLFGTTLG